jgi:hypothetical protein
MVLFSLFAHKLHHAADNHLRLLTHPSHPLHPDTPSAAAAVLDPSLMAYNAYGLHHAVDKPHREGHVINTCCHRCCRCRCHRCCCSSRPLFDGL